MPTPQNVLDILSKLDASDKDVVQSYIDGLKSQLPEDEAAASPSEEVEETVEAEAAPATASDLPQYESGEDYDKATTYKMEAADLKSAGDYTSALDKYNQAITSAPPSALLLANRADVLFKLERFSEAVADCNVALENNPDSAKACRIRGRSYKELGEYEKARKDLSAAQQMDYDGVAGADLKFVVEKMAELEAETVKKNLEAEEKLKKKAEEIKKAREEAKREAEEEEAARSAAGSGMPDMGGMPGGMPGMGGGMPGMGGMGGMGGLMSSLLSDPELAAGLQNPKVMAAFQSLSANPAGLMSNPGKLQELMTDPEVGPFMQKLMSKMGGGMPGMGGMGGGMPDFGGMGGGDDDGDDDIPDLDDLPDLE